MEVHKLEPNIVAKIKSSTIINSVTQCIMELVLNSLDAKSTAVAVRINFVTFRIQVVDNGDGITKKNLNLIGERHATSKCNGLDQLESHCVYYGFRGEALASIVNISQIVEITSKPKNSSETWSRKFTKTARNNAISVKDRPSCGTTVTIEGFLYNLPLRKKCVVPEVELMQIKRNIESLIIMQPNVSFSLRNDVTGELILNSRKCGDVISSFKSLHPEFNDDYSLIKVSKNHLTIKALLFKELWENSSMQYIFVNKRPVKCTKIQAFIHNLLRKNRKFANRAFHSIPNEKIKHHVYVISIKCPYSFVDILLSPTKTVVEFKNWALIFSCIEKLVFSFLGLKQKTVKENVSARKPKSDCGISQIHGVFKGYGVKRKINADVTTVPPRKMQKINAEVDSVAEVPQRSADISSNDKSIRKQINNSVMSIRNQPRIHNTENIVSLKNTNNISEFSCKYSRGNDDNDLQKCALPVRHISNKAILPLPVKVFNKKCIQNLNRTKYTSHYKINSKIVKTNISRATDNKSSLTKFTNDESKGKNLIMDMFLKSTQVYNSDDECQDDKTKDTVFEEKCNYFLENTFINDENKGKNLIMDMFLKSTQVYNSDDECQNDKSKDVAFKKKSSYFLANKFINDENKGKNLIMDIFLKSTQAFNSDDEHQNDKSSDTVLEQESNYFLENNITTNINGKSKTMSVSINITRKLMKKRTMNKKHRITSKSIQTSLQKNMMVAKCVQTSTCRKHEDSDILNKHTINNTSKNYTIILTTTESKTPKFQFVYQSPLHFTEPKMKPPNESHCNCNCHTHKNIFNFGNYTHNGNVKSKHISKKANHFSKLNFCDISSSLVDTFGHPYTKQQNLRLTENVSSPERDYCSFSSPYLFNTAYEKEHNVNNLKNVGSKNEIYWNASLNIDRRYESFNPQYQSTQMNQCLSKEKDLQRCSSKNANKYHVTPNINSYNNLRHSKTTTESKAARRLAENKSNSIVSHNLMHKKISSAQKTKATPDLEELYITLSNRQKQEILKNELYAEKQFCNKINLEWASQMAISKEKEEAKQNNSETFLEDWIKKQNDFGSNFYINTKTGFTTFYTPKPISNDFKLGKRFEFMPKGLSPILKEIKEVDQSLSQNKKDKLENYILESHQNDLLTIKWQNYIKNNDIKKFFYEMYREKLNALENCIPSVLHNKKYFSELSNSVTFDTTLFNNITVLGQLDKKFIVVLEETKRLLILFDQHAVHERIRLEELLTGYSNAKVASHRNKFVVFLSCNDLSLLKKQEEYLNFLRLHVEFFEDGLNIIDIPLCLYNKFKDSDGSLNAAIQLLVKEIIDLIKDTRGVTFRNFPKIIQNILNLEACRGAIKFGDSLSNSDCEKLLKKLSLCNLPFQCAHGRPTLVPLLTLNLNNPTVPKTLNFKNIFKKNS